MLLSSAFLSLKSLLLFLFQYERTSPTSKGSSFRSLSFMIWPPTNATLGPTGAAGAASAVAAGACSALSSAAAAAAAAAALRAACRWKTEKTAVYADAFAHLSKKGICVSWCACCRKTTEAVGVQLHEGHLQLGKPTLADRNPPDNVVGWPHYIISLNKNTGNKNTWDAFGFKVHSCRHRG